jgi:predicted transport protein
MPIYSLLEKELKIFREYIEKNVAKGYIRFSKLLVRYLILFVLKKNEKLRIYVNYRKLNNIIIKNRYTLPLIHEI